ncbi:probable disease resistance protein, partial [Tanacetum coccineum]
MDRSSSGGWLSGVPLPDGFVIGFDDQVKELKKMVLKDSVIADCSVVVVSAGGGCGKTTLVTMLCR